MVLRRKADPGDFDALNAPVTGPMRVMSLEEATGPQRIVRPASPPDDLEAQLTAQGWLPPAQASFLMQQIASLRKLLDDMRWRKPVTDHGDFINVMSQRQMNQAVRGVNSGRRFG